MPTHCAKCSLSGRHKSPVYIEYKIQNISTSTEMEASTENNFTTEAQPSGSSVDWFGALQSSEFRAGLAEFVANTVTQMKDSTSASPSGSHAGVEAVGNGMPGTGDVVVSQPQIEPTNAQGTSIIAPSFIRAVGTSNSIPSGQGQAGLSENVETQLNPLYNPVSAVQNAPSSSSAPVSLTSPFVLGPGRPPIPAKVVTQILCNKFIEMSDLLPENLDLPQCESSSFAIEGGAIVPITRVASKRKQEVTDILTWVECFTSYITVLTTYIPNRSRDLLSYMALIIRMAKRYSGNCWLNYDRAFRLEAAASNIRDWRQLKPDLYSYHTSISSVERNRVVSSSDNRHEPRGLQSATEICRSWNSGACVSPRDTCRFRHCCNRPGCGGPHRRINCRGTRERSPRRQNDARRHRAESH